MKFTGANVLMGGLQGTFDGHAHVFAKDLNMIQDRRYTPAKDALLSDYAAALKRAGLDGGILVQPSFLGTDNSYMLNALRGRFRGESITLRGVAVLPPTASFTEVAEMDEAGIVGLRFNLYGKKNLDASFFDPWKSLLNRVSDMGWHVELHCESHAMAHLLPLLLQRAERVVVDHFGLPDSDSPYACPGQDAILSAPFGRVFVKASAPFRVFRAQESNRAADLCAPILMRLANHIGPDRILWGSDWPWTQFEDRHTFDMTVGWGNMWSEACYVSA